MRPQNLKHKLACRMQPVCHDLEIHELKMLDRVKTKKCITYLFLKIVPFMKKLRKLRQTYKNHK